MTMASWSEMSRAERLVMLARERAAGLTYGQIALKYGAPSRNTVAGLLYRGLPALRGKRGRPPSGAPKPKRASPTRVGSKHAPRPPQAVRQAGNVAAKTGAEARWDTAVFAAGAGVPVGQHQSDQCRWPEAKWHALATHFCGAPAPGPGPYCEAHALRAYRSPDVGESDARKL